MLSKNKEIFILALIPGIIGLLILISWGLEYWQIGTYFLNSGFALAAVLLGGYLRFVAGFKDIFNKKITVNVFVTIAIFLTVSAGEFMPAAMIVFIMSITGALEYYTLDKNRKSIRNLLNLAPQKAFIKRQDAEIEIPVNEIQIGDKVVVRPGERIPVDGVVTAGASDVNQAPITGESVSISKFKGSAVFSGTFNETGRLEIETSKIGEDTTLAKIVHLVEKAQETKAPIQNTADRFTFYFLPFVLALAVLGYLSSGNIKTAVSILLVACPCAFAIATPTAVTAGISNLARHSVLVKGGIFFELAGKIDILLVDKTGTFTLGRPKVVEVIPFNGFSQSYVLELTAIAEKYSEHSLARAVVAFAGEQKINVPDPDDFQIKVGMGVTGKWKDKELIAGNENFLVENGIEITQDIKQIISDHTDRGETIILTANGGKIIGLITIADEIRPEIKNSIRLLKEFIGIKKIIMLTGDNYNAAKRVCEEIGIDSFEAGLLPEQKQEYIKKLKESKGIVGMIGDGINDAPALAMADVGIAMGSIGTDATIETADIILVNDDISKVVDFMYMSRKVLRRIKLNIFFSIIYNVIGLSLSFFGFLNPILAVIFQEAGCITVVLSSALLLWAKPNPYK